LSDIHWNPFYTPHSVPVVDCVSLVMSTNYTPTGTVKDYGQLNCDPPFMLFTSLVADLKSQFPNGTRPDLVLITGDFNPHGMHLCGFELLRTLTRSQR
jgi:hypothetical protein